MCFSWGSGANPWGPEREDQFNKPTHYDGNLEIVGVTGVVHMGQIHSGLRNGIRIAQGGHVSNEFMTSNSCESSTFDVYKLEHKKIYFYLSVICYGVLFFSILSCLS